MIMSGVIGGISIHFIVAHADVVGWSDGIALVDSDFIVVVHHSETHSTATLDAQASVPDLGPVAVRVSVEFPPPPGTLNLKTREQVDQWVAYKRSAKNFPIFVDVEGGETDGLYRAVAENTALEPAIALLIASFAGVPFAVHAIWVRRHVGYTPVRNAFLRPK